MSFLISAQFGVIVPVIVIRLVEVAKIGQSFFSLALDVECIDVIVDHRLVIKYNFSIIIVNKMIIILLCYS